MKKVTVYIPTHNYGRYVDKAIQSVIHQTMHDWELVIINDGSTDNTSQIVKKYASHPKIRVIEQIKKGLNVSNNIALRLSNARYFMRLDADDYLDENALLVLSNVLDTKPEVGLVYPDYYLIDEKGEIIEAVRRKKLGREAELLDLPAHGACTMFRKECLLELGGYKEEFDCQDGYELWLRFLQSFKPYNVNIPLFYYRQHHKNLTKNERKILDIRGKIKRSFVEKYKNNKVPRVLAIIPVIKQSLSSPESAFSVLAGKPLIEHTLERALGTNMLDRIAVTTNDKRVLDYSAKFKGVITVERPSKLISTNIPIKTIVMHVLDILKKIDGYAPDAVMILYVNAPLRKTAHIERAIDTMTIFDVDTVVSVAEELAYCYFHQRRGLTPVQKSRGIRIERKGIYKEGGGILLTRVSAVTDNNFHGKKVGHIVVLPEENVKVKSPFDLWLAGKILTEWSEKEVRAKKTEAKTYT